jgi:hypothetical protein
MMNGNVSVFGKRLDQLNTFRRGFPTTQCLETLEERQVVDGLQRDVGVA